MPWSRLRGGESANMHLDIDGARFDVLDEGTGPAIVLLHGFPLAKETWNAQAAQLRSNARVVRFDLRGLGATSVTPGPYLMESLASDVAAVLDALGIERAIVAGHSLGGYVAFAFYRLFAERCLGLGIVCSRATADAPDVAAARYTLADRAEGEGIAPVLEAFVPRYFAPGIYATRPDLVARAQAIAERTDPRGAAAMLRGMAERVSSEDLFAEIDVPVRVVAGTEDAFVAPPLLQAIAGGIRGAELDALACGHLPQFEAPDELGASLARLVAAASVAR
jgi:pimeloyl-ACP methyl ester carboxylesterase